MQICLRRRILRKIQIALFLVVLVSLAPVVRAQAPAVPLNLPGFSTHEQPPAGFDPRIATDADLDLYGFPPRPEGGEALATWQRAMAAGTNRVIPQLEATEIYHRPFIPASRSSSEAESPASASNVSYSSNWSGAVAFSGASSYGKTSFYYIFNDYVIPVARQAYGACTGSYVYSSSWVGIDGYDSSDVLQAGTESDAYCKSGTTATFYSPWIEWYPNGETRITNIPATAGDDIFVEVWNTSSTVGNAYFVNYRTGTYGSISFTAPKGTTLKGNSAEWIVERPGLSTGLATLTNYVWENFNLSYALTHGSVTYNPGSSGALQITMLDNSGSPISYPTLLSGEYLWMRDEGSAYGSGIPKEF
jgi:hypothetical protein